MLGQTRAARWLPMLGYLGYVGALTAGYYYNLTFVQLGLVDLGTRVIGMERREVSVVMAVLALATLWSLSPPASCSTGAAGAPTFA